MLKSKSKWKPTMPSLKNLFNHLQGKLSIMILTLVKFYKITLGWRLLRKLMGMILPVCHSSILFIWFVSIKFSEVCLVYISMSDNLSLRIKWLD